MTRKKTSLTEYHRRARIRVLVSFDDMRQGEEFEVHVDAIVGGWISIGVVEIVEELGEGYGGAVEAGSGGAEPDVLVDVEA